MLENCHDNIQKLNVEKFHVDTIFAIFSLHGTKLLGLKSGRGHSHGYYSYSTTLPQVNVYVFAFLQNMR